MEARIMALVEESCMLSARPDPDDETSTKREVDLPQVNMGNIYFKMGEHPKALKLYRMALDQTPTAEKDLR
ncbi:putative tetratricopeptide repeat protein 10, tpr10 [Operophtera brumata]|uniref:Putative tetratricopeptide repeat protein 10, tpr10 n=1 Tax=Operophtera brumata TaxID=104452 RepID=A0A0L7LWG4_OPEBR|nr:putative tetratricopeptide repeat protein 10, tpr10 [Operophtera brumata]